MTGKTHLAVGLLVAVSLPGVAPAEAICTAVGSLLPDIDSPTSTLGRMIPVLPHLIGHRTWPHTIWFLAGLGFFFPWLGLRILTHLILDAPTKDGLTPLWPIPWKIKLPFAVRTGGIVDVLLGCVCWVAVAAVIWMKLQRVLKGVMI